MEAVEARRKSVMCETFEQYRRMADSYKEDHPEVAEVMKLWEDLQPILELVRSVEECIGGVSFRENVDSQSELDFTRRCESCGGYPVVSSTGLCHSCTYGNCEPYEGGSNCL